MSTPTQAVLGAGSILEMEEPAANFTEIKEIRSIGETGETGTQVDVTRIDSPNATREFIAGLKEGPDKTIAFNRDQADAGQNLLRSNVGTTKPFRLTLSNGEIATFSMAILGYQLQEIDPNGPLIAQVTAKQTGEVAWS